MTIAIFKKPVFDEFTLRLFYNIDRSISVPHDSIYTWSITLDPNWEGNTWSEVFTKFLPAGETFFKSQILDTVKNNVVLLGIKDHLTSGHFDPWQAPVPNMVQYLIEMLEYYKDTQFIILTSVENLEYYIKKPNAFIVPWGGDITNQMFGYKELEPVLDKNLSSNRTFLSLNRNKRPNRFYLLSLLHGLQINQHGLISCMFKDDLPGCIDLYRWKFEDYQKSIKDTFTSGATMLETAIFDIEDDAQIYENHNNDNVTNFQNKLRNYYQETFVELICETSYTEKCFLLTEKTQNSIMGCNFPIWLSSQGTVQFLRDMGLDVFDDVINHRYDRYENPIDRLYAAVNDNIALLTNPAATKNLWLKNKHRFESNVDFIKNKMFDFYRERVLEKILEINNHIGE